jgi:translocator protein
MSLPSSNFLAAAVALGVPLAGGMLGSMITRPQIKGWYRKLTKPSWTPPNWLFPIAWTFLYASTGYGSYRIFSQGGIAKQAVPLALYTGTLVLNFSWTPLFFGAHRPGWALVDILALLGTIGATYFSWLPVDRLAALSMIPYAAWVSYASCLNAYIFWKNPNAHELTNEQEHDE